MSNPAPDAPTPANTTAVILCGGAGRRVGGADKPLLRQDGRPVVEQVLARIAPQVHAMIISANRNLERYQDYAPVVTDGAYGDSGPLAGILAAARTVATPWLLVCPGDAPMLPEDLLARLAEAITLGSGTSTTAAAAAGRSSKRSPDWAAAVALTAEGRQPLPLLVCTRCALRLAARLNDGERRVGAWIDQLDCATADYRGRETEFANLNHPHLFDADQSFI